MTFKQKLIDDGFAVVSNFIDINHARSLFNAYKSCEKIQDWDDDQIPDSSHSIANFREFVELLCAKNMEVANLVGEMVLPTYTYARIYRNGNVLKRHKDRPECEISLSVHLQGDKEWPIYMEKPNGEAVGVTLKPGDAVLYLGCDTPHWRNAYDGEEYGQVFLHYVLSNGIYWSRCFNTQHALTFMLKKHNVKLEVENG